jgi:hypothetical protein
MWGKMEKFVMKFVMKEPACGKDEGEHPDTT